MKNFIDGVNFWELEAMRYYAPPKSWSPEKIKDTTTSRIFSGDWYGARKRDGAFYKLIKDEDGNMSLIGRSKSKSGDYLDKYDWVPHLHPFFESLPNGTCLLGELYLPRDEQARTTTSIMNCLQPKAVSRQEKEENKLHYYVFDILADEGKSIIDMKAEERFDLLNSYWRAYGEIYNHWAEYKSGQELWNMLQEILAEGGEGVVIINGESSYQPGKRSTSVSLKVKKELQDTIDCVIMGAVAPTKTYTGKEIESWPFWFDEQNNEKITADEYLAKYHINIYAAYVDGAPVMPVTKNWFYGWAGSWQIGAYKDGKLTPIGKLSGLTDEMKENWKSYVNKIAEVSCMEIMDNDDGSKGLRHPKLISVRDDIDSKDCTWEKIFG